MNGLAVTDYEAGQRLDRFLMKYLNDAPPGFIYKMLRKKRVKLNGGRASGGETLAAGDELSFYIAPETMEKFMSAREIAAPEPVGEAAPGLDIIYEDENILALNKPRGVLTHPAGGGGGDTLIDMCLRYLYAGGVFSAGKTSVFVPAFCNRLDRNTGGVIICAKTPGASRGLNGAMAGRGPDKLYLAVVTGSPPEEGKAVSVHRKDRAVNRAVVNGGMDGGGLTAPKEMITGFTALAANGDYTLLSVRLVTGRTHQIRAQLSALGYPIAGDAKYGGRVSGVKWQMLHAWRVRLGGLTGSLEYLNGKELCAPPDGWFLRNAEKLVGAGCTMTIKG